MAVFSAVAFIGGLFVLIALMPDFEGPGRTDWDRQEDDD